MDLLSPEVSVQCGQNSVLVRWTESESKTVTDPWFLRLGDCLPSSISVRPGGAEVIFHTRFDDCSFRRLVGFTEIRIFLRDNSFKCKCERKNADV